MKYKITDAGYEEFTANRKTYTEVTVSAKLMNILSVRVGYTLDSLTSQVKLDIRFRKSLDGDVLCALNKLKEAGYVEVGK